MKVFNLLTYYYLVCYLLNHFFYPHFQYLSLNLMRLIYYYEKKLNLLLSLKDYLYYYYQSQIFYLFYLQAFEK